MKRNPAHTRARRRGCSARRLAARTVPPRSFRNPYRLGSYCWLCWQIGYLYP